MILLYVALGGAVGALARFAVAGWAMQRLGPGFPWGTLAVNLAGSVLLGFLLTALPGRPAETELRALVAIGFCGAFTTFSAFGWETAQLLRIGAHGAAALYVGGSVVLSVLGVLGGAWAAERL